MIRKTYYAANQRIIITTKPLLRPGGNDPISSLNKSMVIYQLSCCCKASYIGLKTRLLRKRACPKQCRYFCFTEKKDDIPVKVLKASKRLSIAEQLINNSTCANIYILNWLKIIKTCSNDFDLVKLEVICIF